jgi:hypothetical protein
MSVDTPSLFTQVIQEHLELKRGRNAELNKTMPIDRYKLDRQRSRITRSSSPRSRPGSRKP